MKFVLLQKTVQALLMRSASLATEDSEPVVSAPVARISTDPIAVNAIPNLIQQIVNLVQVIVSMSILVAPRNVH